MILSISAAGSSGTATNISTDFSSLSYVNKHTLISESKIITMNNNNNNDITKQQQQQL